MKTYDKNCPSLLYHSLLNDLMAWFDSGSKCRYGIPKWARLHQRNKDLMCSKSTSTQCYGAKCKTL